MTTVQIERLISGGWGMTHVGSLVTFVPGSIPGEVLTIASGSMHRGYQMGTIAKLLETSPDRIEAPCPQYGWCGGCQFQHIKYEAQLRYKQALLYEAFTRIGKVEVPSLSPPIPSPFPFNYRRWVRFAVLPADPQKGKGAQLGFHQARTHQVVPAANCLLIAESLRMVVHALQTRLNHVPALPCRVETVEVRSSLAFGNHLIQVRGAIEHDYQAQSLFTLLRDIPTVTGIVCVGAKEGPSSRRLRWREGEECLYEQFAGSVFRISDRSFMQANWPIYEMIFHTIRAWLGVCSQRRVLEAFAGVGCLGLSLAREGAWVTVVEENPVALRDARQSAALNHIRNVRFRHARAERVFAQVRNEEYDLLLLNPPRGGLTRDGLQALSRCDCPHVLYLSCDAPALARDVAWLCRSGYRLTRLQSFDMFPQTAHLETLVELRRD
ncbi:MAG: 23S rRNA (uracil(1939)-C(5))-methyltransferase RlmD [Nitrospirae bacterium]|nr:MAG: 23S rRNA (uracil(1939)-C(5))-methyltransferase RlmD [Nitrospirota bacterium]